MSRSVKGVARSLFHGEEMVWPAIVAGVAVALLSYLVGPIRIDLSVEVALASMTTFLFGVLLAFTIARARDRLTLVGELLAKGNAALRTIHDMVILFPESTAVPIRGLVDDALTSQIDYRLVDSHLAGPALDELVAAVYAIAPTTRQEEVLYKKLVDQCILMVSDRGLIDATTGQSLMPVEWISMLLLLALIVCITVVMPGGTLWGALTAGILTGTLVTLLIVVRRLDRLVWHEQASIWEPTSRLFRSMGLDPYVPRDVIDAGRFIPTGRVRVVVYPDPYPDRTGKVVTIADFDPRPDGDRVDAPSSAVGVVGADQP